MTYLMASETLAGFLERFFSTFPHEINVNSELHLVIMTSYTDQSYFFSFAF